MMRRERIRLIVDGDVGRAVLWEAGRRGISAHQIAIDLIANGAAEMVRSWRAATAPPERLLRRGGIRERGALESIVAKAHGPPPIRRRS